MLSKITDKIKQLKEHKENIGIKICSNFYTFT